MSELWAGGGTLFGIAFGTLVGVPVAPLYIAAGALWGIYALPLVALALCVHLFLSSALTHSFLRPAIERLTQKFQKKLPDLAHIGPQKLTLLVRFIPGLPLFVQSYFLCLCNVPFAAYFGWSLVVQLLWAAGFALAGGAFMKGQWLLLACICAVLLVFIFITQRYAKSQQLR